jgi:hypothetical protein
MQKFTFETGDRHAFCTGAEVPFLFTFAANLFILIDKRLPAENGNDVFWQI